MKYIATCTVCTCVSSEAEAYRQCSGEKGSSVLSAVQVYSNNSEVATLHPNQTSFTLTELTPGTLYLISVGAFTGAGEGDREERMIKTDGPTVTPTGMAPFEVFACIYNVVCQHC